MMKFGCLAGVEYKHKIVFSLLYSNGLFEYDLMNKRIRLIGLTEEKCIQSLYRKAILHRNWAWFIPQKAEKFLCINLDTYEMKYIHLKYKVKYKENSAYPYYYPIHDCYVTENYLICVPSGIDSVMIVNMDTFEVRSVYDVNNPEIDKVYAAFMCENQISIISANGLLDKTFDIDTLEMHEKILDFTHKNYFYGFYFKDKLFFLPTKSYDNNKKKNLCMLNLSTEEFTYYTINQPADNYCFGMAGERFVLLFQENASKISRYDHKYETFDYIEYPERVKESIFHDEFYVCRIDSDNGYFAALVIEGYILEFDEKGDILNYYDLNCVEEKDWLTIVESARRNSENHLGVMLEGEPFELREFIKMLII